ncbi:Transposase InsO and inactivated derivatives [Tessaracoccus bendigoensis DSM 12906]|uniref:Transposase InsO and inactivated derivatives n=1 Tax=Tessaracoccus bendigoensis DSM 12906 TaxID=1123357 RepID=A0A1M6LN21_9ACTN|nr:Transposase InsO and inactivated derivatives [Tessaracoccus bendigoensis DSM 12906]
MSFAGPMRSSNGPRLRGGARPPTPEIVAFVDRNRDDVVEGRRLGVELICTVLQVAPSTYYAAKSHTPSARAVRDDELIPRLVELWEANYRVYGVRKLWETAMRAGMGIGRDQTARLMRAAGIEGARRSKRVTTTRRDPVASRHPDLVKREFTATAPNRLWVTDLTFVPTWAGVGYVCFIIDAFSRMIVGWRVAPHMRTEMVLDAIGARWSRGHRHGDLRVAATRAANSPPSATESDSRRSARPPRSEPSATRSTTLWPRPSNADIGI